VGTTEYALVPVKPTICGLPTALSLTVSVAFALFLPVGANVTLIAQLDPAGMLFGQLLAWANSSPPGPVIATLLMVTVPVPVVDNVTVLGGLLVPEGWKPKFSEAGESVTEWVLPVPVSGTVCGVPAALSATDTAALSVPPVLGVNVTLIAHEVPPATGVPQLSVSAKSPLLAPVKVI